jgi:hypothetical protein
MNDHASPRNPHDFLMTQVTLPMVIDVFAVVTPIWIVPTFDPRW